MTKSIVFVQTLYISIINIHYLFFDSDNKKVKYYFTGQTNYKNMKLEIEDWNAKRQTLKFK
jgi:hypothetical protein